MTQLATLPRAVAISDIELARKAASEVSKREGYNLERAYLSGDNDQDGDVQAALLAIRLVRRMDSIEAGR